MKRLLLFAGAVGFMALASNAPAKADVYVDPPSFGRIVYGMTGGQIVLPQAAWEGAYPDGSGTVIAPNDLGFGGGPVVVGVQTRYAGDLFGTPGSNTGYDFAGAGGAGAVNATAVTPVFGSGLLPKADVVATKLGFISQDGWQSAISVYKAPSISPLTTLFGINTNAGSVNSVTVGEPFGMAYTSSTYGFAYYSDNPANNTGTAANQLYNHIAAYQVTDPMSTFYGDYFVGFEDVNFDTAGNPGYHRFDYNDSVIQMSFTEVPEPAFYQMAGLLTLGAFGLLRLRRRSA